MGLVDDDGELTASELLHILLCKEELLDGTDDDTLFIVDGFRKAAGVLLIINRFHQTNLMLKAVDGVLQLAVQHYTVGDHDNGIEQAVVFRIVNGGQPVSDPRNGVGLA